MSRIQKKNTPKRGASRAAGRRHSQPDFDEVVRLIEAARTKAVAAVNASLIDLYWKIGATSHVRSPMKAGDTEPLKSSRTIFSGASQGPAAFPPVISGG